jgi:hypothetical protein
MHVCEMRLSHYSLATCFNLCYGHPQGNLQDYNESQTTCDDAKAKHLLLKAFLITNGAIWFN